MMVHQEKIARMDRLSADVYRMVLQSGALAESVKPGQFLNIRCGDSVEAYLRRPISICNVNVGDGTVDIVFQAKGAGTSRLAMLRPGDVADVMGPLGSCFQPIAPGGRMVVVGGGIGTFPLLFLLRSMPQVRRTALLGFRNREAVVLEAEFSAQCAHLEIATDDGSYGSRGFVTGLLERHLDSEGADGVYICGPTPMMKAATALCVQRGVPVQVSMEQRMGCGVGACLVCACKKSVEDGFVYTHVCKEGPVFNGRDILFD